jgi:hypothetical protein
LRKLPIASLLLVLAPALLGADGDQPASKRAGLVVNYLPPCADSEYLTYERGSVVCRELGSAPASGPDCAKLGQLLSYRRENGSGAYRCVDRGIESLGPADIAQINQTSARLQSLKTTVNSLMLSPRASVVLYCGQYSATPNPSGAILGRNGVTGVAGAASLCATVASCGTGARMCSVYDLYNSVVFGAVPPTLSPSWVYMSAWQHNDAAQVPTGNGLADSCSGFTYPANDKLWYGTTVEWKAAPSSHPALHFQSGLGVVSCASRYPIACCR